MVTKFALIAKENPTSENNPIREWAVRLINENTSVKLGEKAEIELNTKPLFSKKTENVLMNLMWDAFRTTLLTIEGTSLAQIEMVIAKEKPRISKFPVIERQKELIKLQNFYLGNPDILIKPTP